MKIRIIFAILIAALFSGHHAYAIEDGNELTRKAEGDNTRTSNTKSGGVFSSLSRMVDESLTRNTHGTPKQSAKPVYGKGRPIQYDRRR